MARGRVRADEGRRVMISVGLSQSVHLKLRLLATMRGRSATELVAGWVDANTQSVRLPSVGGPDPEPEGRNV